MTTKHTPTPWDALGHSVLETLSGKLIARTPDYTTTAEEDAAHIVRCVNSHDALVEQVERLIRIAQAAWQRSTAYTGSEDWRVIEQEAHAALEAANQ